MLNQKNTSLPEINQINHVQQVIPNSIASSDTHQLNHVGQVSNSAQNPISRQLDLQLNFINSNQQWSNLNQAILQNLVVSNEAAINSTIQTERDNIKMLLEKQEKTLQDLKDYKKNLEELQQNQLQALRDQGLLTENQAGENIFRSEKSCEVQNNVLGLKDMSNSHLNHVDTHEPSQQLRVLNAQNPNEQESIQEQNHNENFQAASLMADVNEDFIVEKGCVLCKNQQRSLNSQKLCTNCADLYFSIKLATKCCHVGVRAHYSKGLCRVCYFKLYYLSSKRRRLQKVFQISAVRK